MYERLVEVDKVDFLFGPFGDGGLPVISMAEEKGIPLLNAGVYKYECTCSVLNCFLICPFCSVFFLTKSYRWITTTASSFLNIAPSCGTPL